MTKFEPAPSRAARLKIERFAISEIWCDFTTRDEPYGASEGEIEHSKAISLKRIADELERLSNAYCGGR